MTNPPTGLEALRDISNKGFDPLMDESVAYGNIIDPWPIMAEMRTRAPFSSGEYRTFFGAEPDPALRDFDHYTIWRYDAASAALSDPALFSSAIAHKINVEPAFGRILPAMDPPEHTHFRRFLQALFTPRNIKHWIESVIRPLVRALISDFSGNGSAELVQQFTVRYPFDAVYQLLALPVEDRLLFHKLAVTQTFAITEFAPEAIEAGNNLATYLGGLINQRRHAPGDDLISQLTSIEIDGERLDQEIVISFVRHILNAAADTSYRTTGSLVVAMLQSPTLLAELRANRSLIPLAIEEVLRWEGPVNANMRTLAKDVELEGLSIRAGSIIWVAQGSANRDETRFENADRFDLHRSRKYRHLGFGGGPHQCIGMQLARSQILEAVNALLDYLPNLRSDPARPPPVIEGFLFRKPRELRVVFG